MPFPGYSGPSAPRHTEAPDSTQHPSPATVLRMLRDYDDQMVADAEMQTPPTTT
ncbi:hypothetical protein [Streptomyces sp. NBC_01568]|uniref:hypothetical protein n=1 Tax=Streptomyces sp. NBC_01568 TaxID=2975882 RepID=UPI002F9135E4